MPLACVVPKDCHSSARDYSPFLMKLLLLPREEVPKHHCPCLRRKRLLDLQKRDLPLGEKSEQKTSYGVHSVVEDKGIFSSRISADGHWWEINNFLHFLIRKVIVLPTLQIAHVLEESQGES